jgi:hypothetical protein
MDVDRLLNLTGTLISVVDAAPDEYGDPTETTKETTVRYWVDRSAEHDAGNTEHDWQIATLDLYLPAGTDVTGADRFRDRDGVVFELLGPPYAHVHPRSGEVAYVAAKIRRVD